MAIEDIYTCSWIPKLLEQPVVRANISLIYQNNTYYMHTYSYRCRLQSRATPSYRRSKPFSRNHAVSIKDRDNTTPHAQHSRQAAVCSRVTVQPIMWSATHSYLQLHYIHNKVRELQRELLTFQILGVGRVGFIQ